MTVNDFINTLDKNQRQAVTLESNGVITAGAGSGKTRVLASRYVWLTEEKKIKPEQILTLTFTNKAAGEMYSRIYLYLLECSTEQISSTIENFYKAKISTIDSFSASIVKTASIRYGINPDFTSDETLLKNLAKEEALSFVLDNRSDSAISKLLIDNKIREIANELFAKIVTSHSPISSPIDCKKQILIQKEALVTAWTKNTQLADKAILALVDISSANKNEKMHLNLYYHSMIFF